MTETGQKMHIEWCLICGAINLIQMEGNPEPCGDPAAHLEWHRKRGELPQQSSDEEPEPDWRFEWELIARDGDGNAVLKHKSTGGRYRIIPEEDL